MKDYSCAQKTKQLEKDYKKVQKIADFAAKELGQDSVMVSYDNIRDASFRVGACFETKDGKKVPSSCKKEHLGKKYMGKQKIFAGWTSQV